jgi:DNA-binding MarR family transcriptional regulator
MYLQPADLLIVAKLAVSDDPDASVRALAAELGLSKSSVATSLLRLQALDLVKDAGKGGRRVNRLALRDCFEHAIRWLAPARAGKFELGLPTAHTSETMANKLSGDVDPVVIPLPHGPMRGRAVTPLHPAAPKAAERDPKLHRLLAVLDSFRIGGAREREVARAELAACL